MKIVNAVWELKNLGKRTVEITLESKDFACADSKIFLKINETCKQYQAEYVVIKVRTGHPQIGNELCRQGFFHIETQLNLKAVKEDVKIFLERYANFFEDTVLSDIQNLNDLEEVKAEILKGIFTNDRISLDKNFGIQTANIRYANWTEDEFKRGARLSYVVYNNEKIGFSLRRYNKNSAHSILAGIFVKYKDLNIGGNAFFAGFNQDLQNGINKFYTSVSSNNLPSLRIQQLFGYNVDDIYEVYVKHF